MRYTFYQNTLYFMSKQIFYTLLVLFVSGNFFSCYYDVEEELYKTNCDADSVGYTKDIAPIIVNYCDVCHNDVALLGAISLESYNQVKVYVDNGKFLGSVRHDAGYSAMPQGGAKLSACDIQKIEKWIDDGAPNN